MKWIIYLGFVLLIQISVIYGQPAGPNSPAASGTDNSVGTIDWNSSGNVLSSDNTRASTNAMANGDISYYITATDFGFSIPAGATIDGIEVDIERSDNTLSIGITEYSIMLIKGGVISGNDNSTAPPWPDSDTYKTYGSSTDLWGLAWAPADINASNFGVAISIERSAGGSTNVGKIDHIQITVYYTPEPLPIELLYFYGTNINNSIKLKWSTASESNNDYFVILKCRDGKSWMEIGKVKGSGNSSLEIHYEYIDTDPSNVYNYYCLKQVDYNGNYKYFQIIAVKHSIYAQYTPYYNILGQRY